MVGLAAIDHGHQADGARVNDSQRNDWLLAEHEDVERVIVFGERLRNEAVVRRIINGRVEDAVEFDKAAGLIQFVLHARSERDLDDAVEFLRELVAGSYVVPGMDHKGIEPSSF
jgi:hypothetical protein